jgi:hypothetical protein
MMVPLSLLSGAASGQSPARICETAGRSAEQSFGVPSGLLLAIGRVESGRWDRAIGRVVPWPWAVNLAGTGRLLETREAAIRIATEAFSSGHRNIDVGCFQVNLLHHPTAFVTIDQGFDPEANARYAARFLTQLRERLGSWTAAVEAYHSRNPARAIPYGRAVRDQWVEAGDMGQVGQPIARYGIRVWTPSRRGTAPSIVNIETKMAPPARQ